MIIHCYQCMIRNSKSSSGKFPLSPSYSTICLFNKHLSILLSLSLTPSNSLIFVKLDVHVYLIKMPLPKYPNNSKSTKITTIIQIKKPNTFLASALNRKRKILKIANTKNKIAAGVDAQAPSTAG